MNEKMILFLGAAMFLAGCTSVPKGEPTNIKPSTALETSNDARYPAGIGDVGTVGVVTPELVAGLQQVRTKFLSLANDPRSPIGQSLEKARLERSVGYCHGDEDCAIAKRLSAKDLQLVIKSATDYNGTWRGNERDSDPGYLEMSVDVVILAQETSYGGRMQGWNALDYKCDFRKEQMKQLVRQPSPNTKIECEQKPESSSRR